MDEAESKQPQQPKKSTQKAKSLAKRVKYAMGFRVAQAKNAAEYRKLETGVTPTDLPKMTKDGQGEGWNITSASPHALLRSTIVSSLIARDALWISEHREGSSDTVKGLSRIMQALARKIWTEFNVRHEMACALSDALPCGDGFAEVDFDNDRKLPRIRWVDFNRVLLDAETDGSPMAYRQRWRGVQWQMPLSEAKLKWPDHKFTPTNSVWDDDAGHDEASTEENDATEVSAPMPSQMVRLLGIYLKGDSPDLEGGDIGAGDGEKVEPKAKEDVSEEAERTNTDNPSNGSNTYIVCEVVGDLEKDGELRIIAEESWECPDDHDEFPLKSLRLTLDTSGPYAHSLYQPGHAVAVMLDWLVTFYFTDTHKAASRAFFFDRIKVDETTLREALLNPSNLRLVGVDGPDKMPSHGVIEELKFDSTKQSIKEAIGLASETHKALANIDQVRQEARSHRTATDAAIQNENAQLYLGFFAEQVERFAHRLMRTALMCARYHMSAQQVAAWVGDELMGWTDENKTVSKYWSNRAEFRDIAVIRREVDVTVMPRSMRFAPVEQEVNDLNTLFNQQIAFAKVLQGFNFEVRPEVLIKPANALFRRTADLLQISNADEIMIDFNGVLPPPPEAPPAPPNLGGPSRTVRTEAGPDGTLSREVTDVAPELPPQAVGAMRNQMRQGNMSPASLPPDLRNAVGPVV